MDSKKVCLVTGGSSGIGLATAKQFARNGYVPAICGRDETRLQQAVGEIESLGKECFSVAIDLGDPGAGTRLATDVMDSLGQIDVLVNNAALSPFGPFEEISSDEFQSTMQVNAQAVFELTQFVWKQMLGRKSGVIVNVSSLAAVDPFTGFSLYGATKAWMDLLTVALADEGKEKGIRVYSVRPGAVETKMLRGLFPDFPADQCVSPETIAEKIWECVSDPVNHDSGSHYSVTK